MKLLFHWGKVTVPICLPQWMKERIKGVFRISLIKGITFDNKKMDTRRVLFYSQKNAILFLFIFFLLCKRSLRSFELKTSFILLFSIQ